MVYMMHEESRFSLLRNLQKVFSFEWQVASYIAAFKEPSAVEKKWQKQNVPT